MEEKSKSPGPIAPVITRVDLDSATLRSRWERSQKDLDREKQSRRAESAQTAAKLAELQGKLRNTTEALERARAPHSARKKVVAIVSGCVAALLILGGAAYFPFTRPVASVEAHPATRTVTAATRPQVPRGAFSSSASRLSEDLSAIPGRSQEEIFRELNARSSKAGPVCPMEWSGDQPAVVFGSGQTHIASLDDALTRCAEAVEQLPH